MEKVRQELADTDVAEGRRELHLMPIKFFLVLIIIARYAETQILRTCEKLTVILQVIAVMQASLGI